MVARRRRTEPSAVDRDRLSPSTSALGSTPRPGASGARVAPPWLRAPPSATSGPEPSRAIDGNGPGDDPVAIKALVACATDVAPETDLRTAILDGFEQANRSVTGLGGGAATTLAALEINDSTIRPYHVGDSAIMVVGRRGRLRLLTVSHSPVGYAVEAGLLDEREAIHHEDRHLVSNIVGTQEMRIEIGRTLRLNPLDSVLLSSDGLFDNLHTAEIVEIIRKGPLAVAAERLVENCRRRMQEPQPDHPSHPDDLTFLIYRSSPDARGTSRRPLTTM